MKLLVDMNLSPAWAAFLRGMQVEASHWSELGAPGAPDSEIMAYAREHDMIVLTNDLDFSAILAATAGAKPSVIQLRASNLQVNEIGERVIAAILRVEDELARGAVLTIDMSTARLRLLPFADN